MYKYVILRAYMSIPMYQNQSMLKNHKVVKDEMQGIGWQLWQ